MNVQRNPDELNVGAYGGEHLNGAGKETTDGGRFGCIMPYADTVFSALVESDNTEAAIGKDVLTGATWPSGIPIFGDWKKVRLTSGRCIAYKYRVRDVSP